MWNARNVRAPVAAVPGQDRVHPSPTRSSGSKSSAGPKPTMRAPVAAASAAAPGAWSTCVWVTRMVRTGPNGAAAAMMAAVWVASAGPGSMTTGSAPPTR